MNPDGHSQSLVPGAGQAQARLSHGFYSRRSSLDPAARALAEDLLQAPHLTGLDSIGAEEIAALVIQLDRIDAALSDGRVESRGKPRALLDVRQRMSGRLEKWLAAYGLTPASRADLGLRVAAGANLADELRRRAEGDGQ